MRVLFEHLAPESLLLGAITVGVTLISILLWRNVRGPVMRKRRKKRRN